MLFPRSLFSWKSFNRRLNKSSVTRFLSAVLLTFTMIGMLALIPQTSTWIRNTIFDGSVLLLFWIEKPFYRVGEFKQALSDVTYYRKHHLSLKDAGDKIQLLKNKN